MGKLNKKHNWKSRQVVNTVIDESEQNKIKVEFGDSSEKYDACNALVLPSKKRKTKRLRDKNDAPVKLLSNKQRKKLEKITERKSKKKKKEELFEALSEVQANKKDMACLTSLQSVQTLGRKKYLNPEFDTMSLVPVESDGKKVSEKMKWKTPKSVKREMNKNGSNSKKRVKSVHVVQSESSSSSEDEESEPEDEESEPEEEEKEMNEDGKIIDLEHNALQDHSKCNEATSTSNVDERIENSEKIDSNLKTTGNKSDHVHQNESSSISEDEKSEPEEEKEECECCKELDKIKALKEHLLRGFSLIREQNCTCNGAPSTSNIGNSEKNESVDFFQGESSSESEDEESEPEEEQEELIGDKWYSDDDEEEKRIDDENEKMLDERIRAVDRFLRVTQILQHHSECEEFKCNATFSNVDEKTENSERNDSKSETKENKDFNIDGNSSKPVIKKEFKLLDRDPDVQTQRLKLPILSEEHTVMEAINENPITIIVGQTGSGKTTQVPQFLYEAGYTSNGKMIGVTEPRRVAAIQMSERVAYEMNLPSSKISYQIRFDGNSTEDTEIKFMTDGVLFREIRKNHFLDNYSAIIIDEAHERSVHSDILIGLLSRIVPKREKQGNPLKLIIMSATLRVEDFTKNPNLFREAVPPVVNILPRMFNVTIYFNKETDSDYCSAAYRKVCKIHRELPEGGILVFLTGQQEITELCRHLKRTFPVKKDGVDSSKMCNFKQRLKEKKEMRSKSKEEKQNRKIDVPDVDIKSFANLNSSEIHEVDEDEILDDDPPREFRDGFRVEREQPLWVLPLYSMLPKHKQKMVFDPPPDGTRLCVVSTNVAETSLTIPNIKYVVDCGKTKEKIYDQLTGVSSYHITWTSKASANQRSGRAGRTSDGFCYRLYSSAVFNDELPEHSAPDVERRPLDDVILSMKALKVPVVMFPFPTPPDPHSINRSLKRLHVLGALKNPSSRRKEKYPENVQDLTRITNLGMSMANFPVASRFAKMILCSLEYDGILPYIVLIIAALTVQEVLIEVPIGGKNLGDLQKKWESHRLKWGSSGAAHLLGDILVLISAILEADAKNATYEWCQQRGIRQAALMEVRKLRRQLTNEINLLLPEANLVLDPQMKSPNHKQACQIAEVLLKGSLDQVARRVDREELETMKDKDAWRNAYRTLYSDSPAFLSLSSCLKKEKPKYVMYQDIYESTKIYLRGITVVDERWLVKSTGGLVELSPPLDDPKPYFKTETGIIMCWRRGTFGPHKWPLNDCEVEFPESEDLYKWMGYFLLSGKLWPPLEEYVKDFYDPKMMISPFAIWFRREREDIRGAFSGKMINSRKRMEEEWQRCPDFLRFDILDWFKDKSRGDEFFSKWPLMKKGEQ